MNEVTEAAIHAFEQGWSPIPIVRGEKRPLHSDWTNTKYKTRDELKRAFDGNNIGLLLGDKSKGLIDIDLDSYYARKLADGFLPVTRMIHGRDSSPRSHYWYIVEGWSVTTHKFADPTDDEALVEIRGTGGQSLIPPSIHPKGEKYEWLGEWHPPTHIDYYEIKKQVSWLAAAALLAKHWPGQGQRHDAALALAGGILNMDNEELKKDAEAFVASVALCAGDEEGFERQQDVSTTRAKIEKGKRVKGWPTLAKIIDKAVVRKAMEWLALDDEEDTREATEVVKRELINLDMTLEPEPQLVDNLLYEEYITWLQGAPGGGKTIFALWLCLEIIKNKKNVLFIDEESGLKMVTKRLIMLGADQELLDKYFWYCPKPSLNALDSEHRESFRKMVNESQPSLVVFDSCVDMLSQAGLSENDNDDVNRFMKEFIEELRKFRIAVLVIDHMNKANPQAEWARGAGSKKSKTDVAWTFTKTREFSTTKMGKVSLTQAKDRLGELPKKLSFEIGGDGTRTIVRPHHVVKEVEDSDDPYVHAIIQWLSEHVTTEQDAISSRELSNKVKGDKTKLSKAMQWLKDNIEKTPLEVVPDGNADKWFYAAHESPVLTVDMEDA